MQSNDLIYQLALTMVPNVGDVHARALVGIYGNAASVFSAKKAELERIEGIGSIRARSIKAFKDFTACEAEIQFMEKYSISPLFLNEPSYPRRLLNCYDSPILLYYRGTADLNASRIVSIVGTRAHSEYGKMLCEKLVEELSNEAVLIVSGLAFGIDSIAHKSAIKYGLPTVGVMAHGLDRIYPIQNRSLAKQMMQQGGLLTDFPSGSNPDKQNFPKRNRIVAGMCDAIVVIESGRKGGSLITAELANSYNKDVFAFPGRVTDPKSEGCNYLVQSNKATMISGAADLLDLMNWRNDKTSAPGRQRPLFVDLNSEERLLYEMLAEKGQMHVDELYFHSRLSSSAVAAALLMLEMQGLISSLPGKLYRLN